MQTLVLYPSLSCSASHDEQTAVLPRFDIHKRGGHQSRLLGLCSGRIHCPTTAIGETAARAVRAKAAPRCCIVGAMRKAPNRSRWTNSSNSVQGGRCAALTGPSSRLAVPACLPARASLAARDPLSADTGTMAIALSAGRLPAIGLARGRRKMRKERESSRPRGRADRVT